MKHWRPRLAALCTATLLLVGSVPSLAAVTTQRNAKAESPTPEEELTKAQLQYQNARPTATGELEAYVALRRIWSAWRDVEPLRVESALQIAANDTSKSAGLIDYAHKLLAYARLRRGDVHQAQKIFQARGYIKDWLIVGPFDNEGKAGFEQVFEPEDHPEDPIIFGRAFSGKERPVRYRTLPPVFHYGWVDFGHVFRPSTHICGDATTYISDKEDRSRTVTLWVGSDGAHRVTLNGQVVLEDKAYRGFDTGRRAVAVTLRTGQNRLSVKSCGAESSPMFAVRLADEKGHPDPSLMTTVDLSASEQAKENVLAAKDMPLPPLHQTLRGPLSLVTQIEASVTSSFADLFLAAQYLVETGGDDETTHQARNLATRAAEKQSNVELQLLLAALAEDRNAAAVAIASAEAHAQPSDIRVLLARAHHLRQGPSPQDAFPLYDKVLALDPDNLTALQGRVELYNLAGLRSTALSTLERAYLRRPHSLLLSNMVSSQRKALGLSTLATEAEDQYAATRFDDSSWLVDRVELALSRRNKKSALHFLQRIEQSDPQSMWTHRLSSRVHRALGDRKRAVFDLEKGLEIAPEDIGVLKSLADLKGRTGNREEQLSLLRQVLRLQPQEVDIRKYVEHIAPTEAPSDEKYAMASEDFLKHRHASADGHPRRTLQDLTVTTVYPNGLSRQFRQVVFQPLTDSSAATSRQYAFQYQADRQRVELKGARIYRADGSIDQAIESGEAAANDPSISMYTSARTFYVQFPRLEPGDVVELRYRTDDITPRNEFADYYGDVVYLQSDEPVANARYVLITPKSRKLLVETKMPGLKKSEKIDGEQKIYDFVAKNVPALMPEQGMPPWSETLGFVHVSTYSSWDALGKWYWGLVQEQLDLDQKTRARLKEIVKDATTTEDKVKAVFGWVTKNTRYVALEFGIYGYKPRRCVQTVNRGWGDCKDKATVIVTFLRELGIDAHLVILRTQMRGDFRSNLPSLAPFDHAIAYVPELDLYLDGTAEHTGIHELPVMDQGALGLLILDGKAKLVRLPSADPAKNVIEREFEVNVEKSGGAQLSSRFFVTGSSAPGFRARYGAPSTRKDRLSNDLGQEFPGIALDVPGISTSDLSDPEQPVEIRVGGKVPRFGRQEGGGISLPVTVQNRLTPSYAALSRRKQDVKISGFPTRKETVTVHLPPGAQVDATPPDSSHDSRFGSYSVSVKQEGRTVTVTSHLSLKVERVSPADYAEFRIFCVAADEALSHRLVVTP